MSGLLGTRIQALKQAHCKVSALFPRESEGIMGELGNSHDLSIPDRRQGRRLSVCTCRECQDKRHSRVSR